MIATTLSIACGLLLLITPHTFIGRGWRGIVPLHSTCEDVKRLLGISKCGTGFFDFKDERVFILFSTKPCLEEWNVQPGTVTSIQVYPKGRLRLQDLDIDLARFRKESAESEYDLDRYINEEEGLQIAMNRNGEVHRIGYFPTTNDAHLRSPNWVKHHQTTGGDPHGLVNFDAYSDIAVQAENEHLRNFAILLHVRPGSTGFIVAYAGRRSRKGEAHTRAERAKNYLVSELKAESAGLVAMDGGYRETSTVELFLAYKGSPAPVPEPTLCPNEVQIIPSRTRHHK